MSIPQVALDAANHYLSKGVSRAVAIGAPAVFMVESGLDPKSENNTGTETGGAINPKGSIGIAQWNGPRQADLKSFADKKKLDPLALNTQLDFFLTECANSYPIVWAAIRNPSITSQQFITTMVDDYEIPADKPAEIAKALAFAAQIDAALPTTPVPVLPPIPTVEVIATQIKDVIAILNSLLKSLGVSA